MHQDSRQVWADMWWALVARKSAMPGHLGPLRLLVHHPRSGAGTFCFLHCIPSRPSSSAGLRDMHADVLTLLALCALQAQR